MQFAYQGFTTTEGCRSFLFFGVEHSLPQSSFAIEIDLSLLSANLIPFQEGPSFCLKLLNTALLGGPGCLNALQHYRVVSEDFRPLLVERERRAAEKYLRKPIRRPPPKINNDSPYRFPEKH